MKSYLLLALSALAQENFIQVERSAKTVGDKTRCIVTAGNKMYELEEPNGGYSFQITDTEKYEFQICTAFPTHSYAHRVRGEDFERLTSN